MSDGLRPAPGRLHATPEIVLALCLLVFLTVTVLVPADPAVHGIDHDSGIFLYAGSQILHGKLPYRDVWDHKPPAIFYANALGLWLAHGSRWGVWALELLCLLVAACVAFFIMRRLWGMAPALFGVVLLITGFGRTFESGNYTEEYPLPLHFIAIALFVCLQGGSRRRSSSLLLGVMLGCAFLFRANNIIPEAAIVLALIIEGLMRKDVRGLLAQLLWIAVGGLIPVMVTVVYFWSRGLLSDLLNASILFNIVYSETEITASTPLQTALRAFGPPVLAIATIGYVIALSAVARRRDAGYQRPVYIFLLLGAPMAVMLSDPARRNYLHYYLNWLPFIALLGALTMHWLLSWWSVEKKAPVRVSRIALGAAWIVGLGIFAWGGSATDLARTADMFAHRDKEGVEIVPPLAAYVSEHTNPEDTVLFWGVYPAFNYLSRRESASAIIPYPVLVDSPLSAELNERFLKDLVNKRPALIVDMNDAQALSLDAAERQQQMNEGLGWPYMPANLDEVLAFIRRNYVLLAKVSGHAVYAPKSGTVRGTP